MTKCKILIYNLFENMRYNEIEVPGKYYHLFPTCRTDKVTGKKVRELKTIRVVGKDEKTRRICASINGAPAEWFTGNTFHRWTKENPQTENIKAI